MRHFRVREGAKVQTILVVLVFFILGIGVGAFCYYRAARGPSTPTENYEGGSRLSESTRAALKGLGPPVEIRFYSILGQASGSDSLRAFAGRVDHLLSEYQREADGKIKVTRHNSRSESNMDAAASDGIRAFNLDKGEACFLGITVAQQDQKESLPQLSPEWEPALESDLTRALLRVTSAQSVAARVAANAQANAQGDAEAAEEVKRSLPNLASVSLEEGKQMLRETAMKELKAAMNDIEIQIKEARQRLTKAQSDNSEAEQQAALKQLQQSQAQQAVKLKEIAARLQAQIAALERLKANP